MAKRGTSKTTSNVESLRHKDKRKNIPTEELRDFVRDDENAPKKVLYPRDPDLDPQLVWKGKDEQDAAPLEVPAVPVYIQEKIHPQAIIEDFKATAAKAGPAEAQLDLFSDFNGLPADFADRVDFYHHDGNWSNRLILGDSLLVMTSLAEKEALKGRVQMIYIDPPYGIKFGSNWQVSTRKRDVRDGKAEDAVRQPEQVKAFRDTWELGIHSYLAYLRDRLVVARDLLTESGSIFVQISDENVHLVRCLLDEVFGSENFCGLIGFKTTGGQSTNLLASVCDYLLWYAKTKVSQGKMVVKYRQAYLPKVGDNEVGRYQWVETLDGAVLRELTDEEVENPKLLPDHARLLVHDNITSQGISGDSSSPLDWRARTYRLPVNSHWKTTPSGMQRLGVANRLMVIGDTLRFKRYLDDFAVSPVDAIWEDTAISGFGRKKKYVVETNAKVIERCVAMTTDPGDLVLDPTCGSGTTAYVAEQWGRRWITIDTSRVALTLARTRLMAGRFPYYYLADDYPKALQLAGDDEIKGHLRKNAPAAESSQDVRKGFVFKRVPHVTLKAIANNEEIDAIHAKWQGELDELRKQINKAAGQKWQEWEIPRQDAELPSSIRNLQSAIRNLLRQWWELRRSRQAEIDASIARKADTEVLYDQPYEDNKRVRVTGPFTVESLSPHRTISVDDKKALAEVGKDGMRVKVIGPDDFGRMILENLRAAGVQTGKKGERLKFATLEPYAGQWIHGRGEYTETGGTVKRAAVCIGPEHGTVGPQLVKEAAKEAVQGVGFDVLIVCGFAFDPHVSEESKRYGKLVVLPCRMNPDLGMGELLKKTGSANLFMVFGEPDVEIRRIPSADCADGADLRKKKQEAPSLRKSAKSADRFVAEIKGLDVYDPTTGEIRSSSTDDIACWFIDTNYNDESFFVRHAYFTGADEPYDKLKRALRAEVDESAWSALYSTTSRPFDKPETGKIAIKVINHYGDEVLKVYEVK